MYSTTAANEYLVSVYADGGDAFTVVKPSTDTWTLDAHSQNSSSLVTLCAAYANSTGGSEAASWTSADTTTGWGLIEVAFKLPGGAPVTGPPFYPRNRALRAAPASDPYVFGRPGLFYVSGGQP